MKRKILSITMALALILSMLPSTALASSLAINSFDTLVASLGVGNTFTADGIQFNVLSESLDTGTVEVIYNSYSGNISIPSTVTNSGITYTVTGIADNAFYECSSIAGITIPDSVTEIGENAFYKCISLKSVAISSSLTSIGNYVFSNCSSLTSVTIPDGVKSIGNYAFGSCRALKSVTIPDGVTEIGEGAFFACSSLISAAIPDSVTKLGKAAFDGCSSLSNLTISKNITTIEDKVFWSCSSLRSATIPEKVTSIGKEAFFQCSALTGVTIPSGVTSIGDNAFWGCRKLSNAHFEGSPPDVGVNIFSDTASGFKISYNYDAGGWINPWNGYATVAVVSVSFDSQGGSTVASKFVEVGTKVAEPGLPAKKSYAFAGWYKEPSCETPWNFGIDTVTKNITLYAKWSSFIDTTAPAVLGVSPFGTDAFTSGDITIIFSEAMDTAVTGTVSLDGESTALTGGSWSADARTYTIPYSGLSYGTAYTAAISGFQDEAGNIMVKYSAHRFTTMATEMVTVNITGHTIGNLGSEIDAYMSDHGISDYSSIKALLISGGEIHTIDKTWLYNKGLLGTGGSLKIIDFSGTAFTGDELASYMFGQSTAVETIILPESVTSMESYAFNNCTSLKSINLPSGLTMIDNAFHGCSSLMDFYSNSAKPPKPAYFVGVAAGAALHVPSGYESIWDAADYKPNDWIYFDLLIEPHPPTLDIWPERTSDSTANIMVSSSEPGYCYYKVVKAGEPQPVIDTSGAGVAFGAGNNLTIDLTGLEPGAYKIYAKGKDLRGNISEVAADDLEAYVVPVHVTISNHAAGKLNDEIDAYLTSAGLPGRYEKIKSLTVSGGSLDDDDFHGISYYASETRFLSLSGTSAANIPDWTFSGSPIESVSLPSGLASIGDYAFENCEDLIDITILSTVPPAVGKDTFLGVAATAVIHVPVGSAAAYKAVNDGNVTDNLWFGLTVTESDAGLKVANVTPNGSGASLNGNLAIQFSKAMDTSTKGAVSLDGGKTFLTGGSWSGSTVYTVPYSGLAYSTQYTVTISGFIDAVGNIMAMDSTHKFTTAAKTSVGSGSTGTKKPEAEKNTGAGQTFADVGVSSWFFENIRFVSERGLMNGMGNGEFRPAGSMTRSMIVTVLFRLSRESGNYENAFSDVAPGSWYEKAAAWAAENGIANGVGDSSFAPKQMLTREQLAVMLYNYAKYKGLNTSGTGSGVLDGFTDADSISAWAEDAMKWAVGAGIITGDGASLNPKDSASRAEVAAMLQRFIEKMIG